MLIGWQPWYIRPYATSMTKHLFYCCNYVGNQFIRAIRPLGCLWYAANIPQLRAVSRHSALRRAEEQPLAVVCWLYTKFKRHSHIWANLFAGAWQQLNKMKEKGNRTLLLIVSLIFIKLTREAFVRAFVNLKKKNLNLHSYVDLAPPTSVPHIERGWRQRKKRDEIDVSVYTLYHFVCGQP